MIVFSTTCSLVPSLLPFSPSLYLPLPSLHLSISPPPPLLPSLPTLPPTSLPEEPRCTICGDDGVEATALAADNCVNCGGLREDIPTGDSTPKPAVGSDPADVSRGTWKEGGLSELDIVVILLQVRGVGQVFFSPVMSTTEAWSCCTCSWDQSFMD